MLQVIHERVKGWIAGVIVAVISATFVLWGVQYYLQSSRSGTDAVAKVGNQVITQGMLMSRLQQFQRNYTAKTGKTFTDTENEQIKQLLLQSLITQNVLLVAAKNSGFQIGLSQVNAVILGLPQFQENGQFSQARYQQLLYANSITPLQFSTELQNELLVQQVQKGIEQSAFVLPNEIKKANALASQQRRFRFAIIPHSQLVNSVQVSTEAIAGYYQTHLEEFKTPEKISLEYVELTPEAIGAKITVSDEEARQYYQDNLNNYSVTQNNSHKTYRPFNEVKDAIKKELAQQKTGALLTKKSDEAANIAYTNPTTLQPVAKNLNIPIKTTGLFDRQGAKDGVAADRNVLAAAFSRDILIDGNNSDPIELKDGRTIIFRIKQHVDSQQLSMLSVKPEIEKKLREQFAKTAADGLANQLVTDLKQNESISSLTTRYHLVWKTTPLLKRDDTSIPQPIMTAAFSLSMDHARSITSAVLSNGDAAVIQLIAIDSGKQELSPTVAARVQEKLLNNWGKIDYQIYAQDAHERIKVKVYKK